MAINSTSSATSATTSPTTTSATGSTLSAGLGQGSVIDVNGLVAKMDSIEQAPIDKLNVNVAAEDRAITDLGTIKSKMSLFQAALQDFTYPVSYLNKTVASSNTAAVDAAISNSTAVNPGIYSIHVDSVAQTSTVAYEFALDASGNLLVGVTSQFSSGKLCVQVANGSTTNGISIQDNGSSGFGYIAFANGSGSTIGSIARVTTTNAVVYNTTSDYRLKNVVGSVTGQGERIDALKPIDYQWKDGNISARGFLAHEFQTIYPNSVTGEKDALDAEGKPIYQAMQASTPEVMADLIAEIQSLRKRVAQLESK